jgi:heat-inducible transcriptional repressor
VALPLGELDQVLRWINPADSPAVVMAPPLSAARLTRLSLVPVGSGAALMVVETDDGLLEHRIVDLPPGLDPRTLVRIAGAISEELQGAPLADIASRRLTQLERRLGRHAAFLEELLALFEPSAGPGEQIALEGVPELLEYQEFRDAERIRQVWALLQEDRVMNGLLLSTLREPRDGAVTVRIGAEVPVQELHDMAVVAVNWRLGRDAVGRLAVIGPRRMNYGRVLTVLEYVSAELRRALAAP